MKSQGMYTTGELAKLAGVTTRTIRYYDDKDILSPSAHNDAGHRLYSESDFTKLKRILALKYLGLSLDEVKSAESRNLKKQEVIDSLKLQKNILKNKMNYMKVVLHTIEEAQKSLESDENLDWDKTANIIQVLEDDKELLQQYIDLSNLDASVKLQDKFGSNESGWYKWVFKNMNLKSKYKILEIGCGNGALWSKNIDNIDKGTNIILTEEYEDMIKGAKRSLKQYSNMFEYKIVDPTQILFEDESFDIVIANHVLFFMKDVENVLKEINRVLKVGGKLYSSTLDSNNMKDLDDLVKGFHSNIEISEKKILNNFGPENGEEILSKYFDKNDKKLYKDQLIINDTRSMLEYIYSIPGDIIEVVDTKKKDFEKYINLHIKKEGSIKISNNQILFESTKI